MAVNCLDQGLLAPHRIGSLVAREEMEDVRADRLHQAPQGQGRQPRGLEAVIPRGHESLEAEKRRTVVFLAYLSEDGAEVTIVHVFPGAEAMDLPFHGRRREDGGSVRVRGS
jgi:hypothetical protein